MFAAILSWSCAASAEIINGTTYLDGVTVSGYSSQVNDVGWGLRAADNTINGSGLTAGTGVHNAATTDMWMIIGDANTNAGIGYDGISPDRAGQAGESYIIYDLGAQYDLTGIHVWNHGESPQIYGVDLVNIAASADLTFGSGTSFNLTIAPATNNTGEDVAFTASGVRYVRFDIQSNHGGAWNLTGLSEVRFETPVVPEPATLCLMGLGAIGFIVRRKRR